MDSEKEAEDPKDITSIEYNMNSNDAQEVNY